MITNASTLRDIREKIGMTQRELVARFNEEHPENGLSIAGYSMAETGKLLPPPELVAYMSGLLQEDDRPEPLIAGYIPKGRRRAISRSELRAVAQVSDRRMRKWIEIDRKNHYPICNDQDGGGYYLAETDEEKRRLWHSQMSRAQEILNSVMWLNI